MTPMAVGSKFKVALRSACPPRHHRHHCPPRRSLYRDHAVLSERQYWFRREQHLLPSNYDDGAVPRATCINPRLCGLLN